MLFQHHRQAAEIVRERSILPHGHSMKSPQNTGYLFAAQIIRIDERDG
jgi:hypothetical protein